MRHRKTTSKLSRDNDSRRALLKNLAESVLLHEKITTTEAKAKAVQPYVEKLITKAKTNNLTSRRALIKALPTSNAVNKSLEVLGPRYASRDGGYTRIVKIPTRKGDGAKMAIIELVA